MPNHSQPRVSGRDAHTPLAMSSVFFTLVSSVELQDDPRLRRLWQAIFWAAVLLFIFLVAAGVILRFSTRFRVWLFRKKAPPTPSDDVWEMHKSPAEFPEKFPDDRIDDEEDEPGGEKY